MDRHYEHKNHSGSFWAYVFIIGGILWLMSKSGWDIRMPGLGGLFSGIGHFFSSLASWSIDAFLPVLIIIAGIVLIAGRRFFGALLFVILVMILVPHFLIIPGILLTFLFPAILIIIGIVILSKLF